MGKEGTGTKISDSTIFCERMSKFLTF